MEEQAPSLKGSVTARPRVGVSCGAMLAACICIGGGIVMTAGSAALIGWFFPFGGGGGTSSQSSAIRAILSVEWQQNENANTPRTRRESEVAAVAEFNGALVFRATSEDLAFDSIQEASGGWPPDLAGFFENGLQYYALAATVVDAESKIHRAVVSGIALEAQGDGYLVVVSCMPVTAKANLPRASSLVCFDADRSGVIALARSDTKSKAAPRP